MGWNPFKKKNVTPLPTEIQLEVVRKQMQEEEKKKMLAEEQQKLRKLKFENSDAGKIFAGLGKGLDALAPVQKSDKNKNSTSDFLFGSGKKKRSGGFNL